MTKPVEIFVSYSRDDYRFLGELITWFKPLEKSGKIRCWSDRLLSPGENWDSRIRQELDQARIILFLVSPYFLASDYVNDVEVRKALERHDAGNAIVIPIIVRPCDFGETIFANIQATPLREGRLKPITEWKDRNEAWKTVNFDIKKAISKIAEPKLSFKFKNYARQSRGSTNEVWWDWLVIMDEPVEVIENVDYVQYQLHETFPESLRFPKVNNRKSQFALFRKGWGWFRIGITIKLKNGTVVDTYHDLNLVECWPENICDNCGNLLSEKYAYCPYCGHCLARGFVLVNQRNGISFRDEDQIRSDFDFMQQRQSAQPAWRAQTYQVSTRL